MSMKAHALDVHTGKRLVENENIRHGLKRQCQQNALQFAARERADALVDERFTVDVRKAGQNFFSRMALVGRRNAGRLKMQQVKRSITLTGSPRSKAGLCGT